MSTTPITYINSAADLKASAVATADRVHVLERPAGAGLGLQTGEGAAFPDQHLGRNTGFNMDSARADAGWDFDEPWAGLRKSRSETPRSFSEGLLLAPDVPPPST
jgi:hypothetical protein